MSDLSRLLDDVYGPSGTAAPQAPPATDPAPTGLPDWALDSVLDGAFADWMPAATGPAPRVDDLDDQTGPTPRVAGEPADGAVPAPAPVAARAWSRADDDILPAARGRGAKLARAEAAATAQPSIEAFAAEAPVAAKGRFRRRKG